MFGSWGVGGLIASLALPRAVGPGEVARLTLVFEGKLPRVIARTGCFEGFCLGGHFFPKLAVLEPKGRRGAAAARWSVHQHHAATEFYADFGTWLVRLELPEGFEAGATGVLVPDPTPEAWSAALLSLLQNPDEARRLGRNALARVENEFSLRAVVDRYVGLYRELMAQACSSRPLR